MHYELREKVNYKYLGILESDTIKQVELKDIIKKSTSKEREGFSKTSSVVDIACREKDQSSSPCKIHLTILKKNKSGTSTNELENKKIDNDAEVFTSEI